MTRVRHLMRKEFLELRQDPKTVSYTHLRAHETV